VGTLLAGLRDFMESGGGVLWWIAACTFLMWLLIFDRLWYLRRGHPQALAAALPMWRARPERGSWQARAIRRGLLAQAQAQLADQVPLIRALTSVLPLIGLLGTVTGMIQVFDALSLQDGSARSLAAGVSAATLPTMAGMVATLSGLPVNWWLAERVLLVLEAAREAGIERVAIAGEPPQERP
jgi:biopolymer transport protein ExbB